MKKIITTTIAIMCLSIFHTQFAYCNEDTTYVNYDNQSSMLPKTSVSKAHKNRPVSFYFTVGVVPMKTTDFQDFDVSDWQNYGLKINDPYSAEGRVRIPLSENNPAGYKPSVTLGLNIPVDQKFDLLLDLNYASANNFSSFCISLGGGYHLVEKKKFQLVLTGRVGYVGSTVDFGTVQLIDGYTAPVIIDQGTFTNGDNIQATMSGLEMQIGLRPVFDLSKKLSLVFDAGYSLGLLSNTTIEVNAGAIKLNMDDAALVTPDGYGTQIGTKPSVKIQGIYFQAGIQLKLSKR